jgi:hypothetical protein
MNHKPVWIVIAPFDALANISCGACEFRGWVETFEARTYFGDHRQLGGHALTSETRKDQMR